MTHRALLGMGSNVGDRVANLTTAIKATPDVVAVSAVYETDPVGHIEQERFLNLVVRLETEMEPQELLRVCHDAEANAGRVRRVRWGPRTLDVDILWIDGYIVDEPDLTVPHPRMFERAFVLVPLAEVAPDILPAGYDPAEAARACGVCNLGLLDLSRGSLDLSTEHSP